MIALAWLGALLGVWTAVAPWVFPWKICHTVYAVNVVPGLLVLVIGACAGYLALKGSALGEQRHLFVALTSSMVILGAWILLGPIIAGFWLVQSTFLATMLPGAMIMAAALAEGYLGWRRS